MKKTTTVQAPDRNFADLEAHANLCRYICNLTSHARCHGGSKIGWGSNPPHDDAISSHVYETKGFLSAEEPTTSAATPTHTVTLGVIYSKTSRCMQMRSTRPAGLITIINTRKKLIRIAWNKNGVRRGRRKKVIFIFGSLSDNFPLKYFWQRWNINEQEGSEMNSTQVQFCLAHQHFYSYFIDAFQQNRRVY